MHPDYSERTVTVLCVSSCPFCVFQVNDSDDEEEEVDANKLTLSRLKLAIKYEQKQVRPLGSCLSALHQVMHFRNTGFG